MSDVFVEHKGTLSPQWMEQAWREGIEDNEKGCKTQTNRDGGRRRGGRGEEGMWTCCEVGLTGLCEIFGF